ncbi:hypothetical protein [Pseudooceanicola sp. LIPI14-2-Ac024]|uniref:hypothetical protein n=1 Tax=Pseudooceanicola sp. LIPI14-2-Ac024 TaxID=3344875 RepID=UPI0035CF2385
MAGWIRSLALTAGMLVAGTSALRAQTMDFALQGQDRLRGTTAATEDATLSVNWQADLKMGLLTGEPVISVRLKYDVSSGTVTLPMLTREGRQFSTVSYAALPDDLRAGVRLTEIKLRVVFGSKAGEVALVADVGATGAPGDWSFNVPGSPDWDEVFEYANGAAVPEAAARAAWEGGLTLRLVSIQSADINLHLLHDRYMKEYDREVYRAMGEVDQRLSEGLRRSYGIDASGKNEWTRAYLDTAGMGDLGTAEDWFLRARDLRWRIQKLSALPERLRAGDNHAPYDQAVKDAGVMMASINYAADGFDIEDPDPRDLPEGRPPAFSGQYEVLADPDGGSRRWLVDSGTGERLRELDSGERLVGSLLYDEWLYCRIDNRVVFSVRSAADGTEVQATEFPCGYSDNYSDRFVGQAKPRSEGTLADGFDISLEAQEFLERIGRCGDQKYRYATDTTSYVLSAELEVLSQSRRQGELVEALPTICFSSD